jgi:hypothetical protein
MKSHSNNEACILYTWGTAVDENEDILELVEFFGEMKITSTNVERFFSLLPRAFGVNRQNMRPDLLRM